MYKYRKFLVSNESWKTINSKGCIVFFEDLTNNCELISRANKLGQGIFWTKLQEFLTEVTYEKLKSKENSTPE